MTEMTIKITTGSATTQDWRAATRRMKISAYSPGEVTETHHASSSGRDMDERTKIDADPEDALRALLRTRKRS
jgi:hypothetical protein